MVTFAMEAQLSSQITRLSGPFGKLRSCKSFPEAKARLLAGVPPTRVAEFMHECGDYTHCSPKSLAATLCAYRRTLSASELVQTREPGFVQDAKSKIDEGIDELEELEAIYLIQKDRIVSGRNIEKKIGVLNKTLGNEVRIAGELLRTRATIKEQLGFGGDQQQDSRDVGPAFHYDIRSRYGERVARVIEDPGKRNRVLNAVSALVEAGESDEPEENKAAAG